VTSAQHLGLKPVEDWLEDVPARGWQRLIPTARVSDRSLF
jgi:hypothetical protein